MHQNSLDIVKNFISEYLSDTELEILDLGSRVVPKQLAIGSYRQFITNPKWHYVGADTEAGENVDVVLTDGYKFPFDNRYFDVIISGQTIEHIEYPWVWFIEMVRVLKQGGICCIVAPAACGEHKHPIDTYRYFPDGMRALAKWSGLEVLKTELTNRHHSIEDTYMIAKRSWTRQ